MATLAAQGINSFKFFMAYKVSRYKDLLVLVGLAQTCSTQSFSELYLKQELRPFYARVLRPRKAQQTRMRASMHRYGSLQVTDEELLMGMAQCKKLGALPMSFKRSLGGGKAYKMCPVLLRCFIERKSVPVSQ
eukprot:1158047-Pelagomonas_calceolata.AAC.7